MILKSEELLAMSDEDLARLILHLGLTIPRDLTRDRALELVMKIALSAQDA